MEFVFPVWTAIAISVSTLSALATSYMAWLVCREKKDDERLIFGECYHPPHIKDTTHRESVIAFRVFNKSRRRAYIHGIKAVEEKKTVEIWWSSSINDLGSPLDESSLVGIIDSEIIFICKKVFGEIYTMTLEVTYHFDKDPKVETLEFRWWVDEESDVSEN